MMNEVNIDDTNFDSDEEVEKWDLLLFSIKLLI